MTTTAFIEISPQVGLNNTQNKSGFLTPLLIGFVVGIVFTKWFL
ncbi:MAG: hypothetical protein AAF329_05690 [Cyanobacteria bacterium P01_A01_bin.17]